MRATVPEIVDLPHCRLVRWQEQHAPALQAALLASDAHLRPWTPWVIDGKVPGLTLEERLAWHAADFEAAREWVYGIFPSDETTVLGGAGLYPRVGPHAVEIGYWLAVGHTGRGLATLATAALTAQAFASPDIDHVDIRCERRNVASARVPERLGYSLVDSASAGAPPDLMVWRLTRAAYDEGAVAISR